MKRYNEAYAERDVDGVVALFAPDPDVVIIGTGEEEKRIGQAEIKAQLERDFTQSQAASNEDLSQLLQSLPLWGIEKVDVTPLDSFTGRSTQNRQYLEYLGTTL